MAKITDPDSLVRSSAAAELGNDGNIWIDTSTKTFSLDVFGDLSTDGVSVQAIYSYLKEEWKTDSSLIKFPFPMGAITPEQFEFIDGWQPANLSTIELFRDGGFAVKTNSGESSSEFAGIITLGELGSSDQVYYQQLQDGSSQNIIQTGAVNQCIKIYGKANGTNISFTAATNEIDAGSYAFIAGETIVVTGSISNDDTYLIDSVSSTGVLTINSSKSITDEAAGADIIIESDARSYFKIFVREYQKLYAQSQLSDIGVSSLNYQAYRFPLANAADLKITNDDATVSSSAPYTDMNITYYDTPQTRNIGGTDYDFDIIIDADVADDGSLPTAEQIYEFVEWSLRQNSDIDAGAGNVIGKTADALLTFVGDTLVTSTGVFIDQFSETDINRIEFFDNTGTKRIYPFVAAGSINFNSNLVEDSGAKYWMFFTDANGNNFNDSDAIIVQDNNNTDITGDIIGNQVQFSFDYDGNTQGGRTAGTDAPVTVVAIGLDKAQYVKASGIIGRTNSNSLSLVASLERNYKNSA